MSVLIKRLEDSNEIPMIGLGTWQSTGPTCIKAVKTALEIGYRHIDTADIYDNHEYVQKGIEGFKRRELFITTKLWRDFLDPKKVEEQCDKCLMELDLEYLDLFLIHWPDSSKPLVDIVYEMQKLEKKGKVKSIGVSNFTISHLESLVKHNIKVAVNQVEFHPFLYQKELLDYCNRHGIAITAYSPLARGKVFKDPTLIEIGKKYNKTAGQVSLRWLIQKDIIVVPKGSSKEHIKQNFEIFDFELNEKDIKTIDEIHFTKHFRIIAPEFQEFDY